jgi:hypothetical protein
MTITGRGRYNHDNRTASNTGENSEVTLRHKVKFQELARLSSPAHISKKTDEIFDYSATKQHNIAIDSSWYLTLFLVRE